MVQYDTVIIDAMLLAYRSWWPVRELIRADGTPTGLEYGFIKNVLATARRYAPAKLLLAWDGRPARCEAIFPRTIVDGKEVGYKAGRTKHKDHETEPPWSPRLEKVRAILLPAITSLYHPETEADEEIARWCYLEAKANRRTLIISKDQDLHQLVYDTEDLSGTGAIRSCTHITKGAEEDILDHEKIAEKWNLPPQQIVYFRAISGDSSDGIPGIPRIKKEVKQQLALNAKTLDHLLEMIDEGKFVTTDKQREKLQGGKEVIRRNFQLSELRSQGDYQPNVLSGTNGDTTQALQFCRENEFDSLLQRGEWRLFQPPTCQP